MEMSEYHETANRKEGNCILFCNESKEEKSETSFSHLGCYKWAVACLGLLCVLLALTVAGLCYKAFVETMSHGDLTAETEQLKKRLGRLTMESSHLQTQCESLTQEKTLLQDENERLQERLCHPKMEVTQYAVDVSLDPDTAEDNLILSADGKRVWHVDVRQNLPDNPKRFDPVVCVLAKQGFSTGRFYFEAQVSGKTAWIIGVANESINRKGSVKTSPRNGHWTIRLKDSEYKALAGPSVLLSLTEKPERVGVFVDYQAGLVSFYDADSWNELYSFKDVPFVETIFPFFSPFPNNDNQNSSPLIIITPLSCHD